MNTRYADDATLARIAELEAENAALKDKQSKELEVQLLAAQLPQREGWQLVGYLDGRGRFFYADDIQIQMPQDRKGMRECYASPKEPT